MIESPSRVITVAETLSRLKVGRTRLWDLRRAGKIRSVRDDGGRVFIDEASVERYIEALFADAN